MDSPLVASFTRVYRQLRPFWDAEALGRVRAGRHPLNFEQLYTVGDHAQHQTAVNYNRSGGHPCVVMAASGMCAGGHTISVYSAHADQKDLVNFVKRMRVKPGQIRIVHGDIEAKAELQRRYRALLPGAVVEIPGRSV